MLLLALHIGVTFPIFKLSGNIPLEDDRLKQVLASNVFTASTFISFQRVESFIDTKGFVTPFQILLCLYNFQKVLMVAVFFGPTLDLHL